MDILNLFELYNYIVLYILYTHWYNKISRAGKIEKTDWNVKEIEKKIEENKMGRSIRHDHVEKVPKWSREQVRKIQNI